MTPRRALVVGGGIVGLCAALSLRRDGWAVEVLEQDPVPNPRGASVDRHRLIRHAYGAQRGYMRLVDDAHLAWEAIFAEAFAGAPPPCVATGTLALAAETAGWLGDTRDALAAEGRAFEAIPPAALAVRWPLLDPAGLAAALFLPSGGVLLADRIVAGLARHLSGLGVALRRARVVAVEPERGRAVLADGAVRQAEMLVVAAGPWTARLLPDLAAQAVPSRQVLVYLDPPEAWRAAWAAAPMLLDLSGGGGFYAVPPVAGTPLKIGDHSFSRSGDAEDPREATAPEVEAILALARPRLRGFEAYRVLGARACYYDVAEGERIVLARLGARGVALCGTSGHGFKFGPVLGQALAAAAAAPEAAARWAAWVAGEAAAPARSGPAAARPAPPAPAPPAPRP